MEADWTAEIGYDLPSIDVPWEGFIDLRKNPRRIEEIEEVIQRSALSLALLSLNAEDSPAFTSKCDCWAMEDEFIDADEFAAHKDTAKVGVASYIDLVLCNQALFVSFEFHESWARQLTAMLRILPVIHGRVDLVLCPATVDEQSGFGITFYAAGCGADAAAAETAWQSVLKAAIPVTINAATKQLKAGE